MILLIKTIQTFNEYTRPRYYIDDFTNRQFKSFGE